MTTPENMVFVDELPPDYRARSRHAEIARALRAHPRKWGLVRTAPSRSAALQACTAIRRGSAPAYLPAGAFEGRAITSEDGVHQVWARYVGGGR